MDRPVPVGRTVTFTFEGEPITALEGETIAAALTAAGRMALRRTRSGRDRGVFCGMGVCFECLVSIDGRPGQRACLTKVGEGMDVRRQGHDRPAIDPRRPTPLAEPPAGALETVAAELVVVGAGPAGLAAAAAAAEAGARVTVLDERPMPGGQYFKQLAPSHRFTRGDGDAQFAAGRQLIARVQGLGVALWSEATVWMARRLEEAPDGAVAELGVLYAGRALLLRPRAVVLAPGAYERPYPVPGWTLPGVMTTGAAQTLARAYRVAPGERALVAGNGPLNLQVACELAQGGAHVVAVVEAARPLDPRKAAAAARAMALAPDLMRDGARYLAELFRRDIPVLYGHVLVRATGEDRVRGAVVAPLRSNGRPDHGRARSFEADALCLGYGFLPSHELARQLGCALAPDPTGRGHLALSLDEEGRTTVPGV